MLPNYKQIIYMTTDISEYFWNITDEDLYNTDDDIRWNRIFRTKIFKWIEFIDELWKLNATFKYVATDIFFDKSRQKYYDELLRTYSEDIYLFIFNNMSSVNNNVLINIHFDKNYYSNFFEYCIGKKYIDIDNENIQYALWCSFDKASHLNNISYAIKKLILPENLKFIYHNTLFHVLLHSYNAVNLDNIFADKLTIHDMSMDIYKEMFDIFDNVKFNYEPDNKYLDCIRHEIYKHKKYKIDDDLDMSDITSLLFISVKTQNKYCMQQLLTRGCSFISEHFLSSIYSDMIDTCKLSSYIYGVYPNSKMVDNEIIILKYIHDSPKLLKMLFNNDMVTDIDIHNIYEYRHSNIFKLHSNSNKTIQQNLNIIISQLGFSTNDHDLYDEEYDNENCAGIRCRAALNTHYGRYGYVTSYDRILNMYEYLKLIISNNFDKKSILKFTYKYIFVYEGTINKTIIKPMTLYEIYTFMSHPIKILYPELHDKFIDLLK
jgi:hypothetical protein